MTLCLGDQVPNFHADTSRGSIDFYEWAGDDWVVFSSHPHQFRPVCATEYAALSRLAPRFAERNIKLLMLSIDPLSSFDEWADDIRETQGIDVAFPVVIDGDGRLAQAYGMIHRAMSPEAPMRCTLVISPDKRLKASMALPSSLGRNFEEVLRMVQSLQLTQRHHVATPAQWQDGDDVIIVPGMAKEEAARRFPAGWRELRPYLRMVSQPQPTGDA